MNKKLQKIIHNKTKLTIFASTFVLLVVGFVVAINFIKTDKLPTNIACAADAKLVCQDMPANLGQRAVDYARSQIGYDYVWGGCHISYPFPATSPYANPNCGGNGFDCSGLVMWAWNMAGIAVRGSGITLIGGTTRTQWASRGSYPYFKTGRTYAVLSQAIKPGDLIYFGLSGVHHVAMYSGNGKYIEAPNTGKQVREVDWVRLDAVGFIRPIN